MTKLKSSSSLYGIFLMKYRMLCKLQTRCRNLLFKMSSEDDIFDVKFLYMCFCKVCHSSALNKYQVSRTK